MIQINDAKQCCGCSACYSICPKSAIVMKPDALGFLYPNVDEKLCVNCGLCEKVCSFNSDYDTSLNLKEPLAYGARHKNLDEVASSRSGAAFIALSDWVLAQGGSVYGAAFEGHFRVVHKRAVSKKERDDFKGSKYVQSDMGDVFKQVKADLNKGLPVLFSGTACQVAGLKSFIGNKHRERLFLVDIVCHGVPGPNIWKDYIAYLEKKKGMPITKVSFRNKEKFGWTDHKESFLFADSKTFTYSYSYTYLFYIHIMFRQSCGVCHYANTKRPSDITIADFWGWEKTNPTFNADDKGCSLVLCNTEKGLSWFKECQKDLNYFEAELKNCIQPNLLRPTPTCINREKFERDYVKYGLEYVMKRYGDMGWRAKVRPIVQRVKKIIKRLVKK